MVFFERSARPGIGDALDVILGVVVGLLVNEAPEVSPWLAHRIARLASLAVQATAGGAGAAALVGDGRGHHRP